MITKLKSLNYWYLKSIIVLCCIPLFNNCETGNKDNDVSNYTKQLGDTVFDKAIDDPTFTFCNDTAVLHKRAYVTYKGGINVLNDELVSKLKNETAFKNFTGHFMVRFAVNCDDQTGRFRMQIVDNNFKETNCPLPLKNKVLDVVKSLKGWSHPFYKGENYDGYTFINLKFKNGQFVTL